MGADNAVELPTPRSRPIASQRQFKTWLHEIEPLILHPPWEIVAVFCSLKRGELPDHNDPKCYMMAITYPQYHKIEVTICPDHPNFKQESDLRVALRHEIFHSFFGTFNDVLQSTVPNEIINNPGITALLDNAEDEAVNRLSAMPIFALYETLLRQQSTIEAPIAKA